jgi:diacylglycerol kinase (ATP)
MEIKNNKESKEGKKNKELKRNQPKYSLFKNSTYAFSGLRYALKDETSFKIELVLFAISLTMLYFIDFNFSFYSYLILVLMGMLVLIVELVNSAIENVVDLITNDYHILAKKAKDIGSTAVLFSLVAYIITWVACLYDSGFLNFII